MKVQSQRVGREEPDERAVAENEPAAKVDGSPKAKSSFPDGLR